MSIYRLLDVSMHGPYRRAPWSLSPSFGGLSIIFKLDLDLLPPGHRGRPQCYERQSVVFEVLLAVAGTTVGWRRYLSFSPIPILTGLSFVSDNEHNGLALALLAADNVLF